MGEPYDLSSWLNMGTRITDNRFCCELRLFVSLCAGFDQLTCTAAALRITSLIDRFTDVSRCFMSYLGWFPFPTLTVYCILPLY